MWQKVKCDTQSLTSETDHTSQVAEHSTISTGQDQLEMMENVVYGDPGRSTEMYDHQIRIKLMFLKD